MTPQPRSEHGPRRAYDGSGRAAAAAGTRARVLDSALALFLERGYAGTTIKAVAEAAGVSPETIYKGFGGKGGLAKAVYDVALAGDDEPVPVADRPVFQELQEATDPKRTLAIYAGLAREIGDRAGRVMGVLLDARGADDEVAALLTETDAERLVGAEMLVALLEGLGALRPGLSPEVARDVVWTFISWEVHQLLVARRGWSSDDYERWLADSLAAQLLRPGGP
jgi:AcrR family transcriptional regulator